MKVAVIFLVVLGLIAAVSATILVSLITRPEPPATVGKADPEVDILVAARDLPAVSVVDSTAVKIKKIHKSQLPPDALTSSPQVVGKVLTASMVEGEAFIKTSFANGTAGIYLAAALPAGKRAVSVSLTDWSAMAGLLYPGGVVNVLVSFRPPSLTNNREGDPTTVTTLLQGLQVLAIGSQSIANEGYVDQSPGALASRGQPNQRMVTLLVDPKQAEILQLAAQSGTISLAMRNPLDANREPRRMTNINELTVATTYPPALASLAQAAMALPALLPPKPETAAPPVKPAPAQPKAAAPPVPKTWETTILRGGIPDKRTFSLPEQPEDASPKAVSVNNF